MRRVPELDALRGIAALMILSLHLGLGKPYVALTSAVDLFFVLSGYLITRIILEHPVQSGFLVPFYVRRIVRIWPVYFAVILGFLIINPWLPYRQRTTGWPYYLTFTQFLPEYWMARPPRFCRYFAHTWTLAAEEQFYLIWPLVAVLLGRFAMKAMIPVLIVSAFVARLYLWPMLLVTNWDGFALGALLAWMLGHTFRPRPLQSLALWSFVAIGSAMLVLPYFPGVTHGWIEARWIGGWPELVESINASRVKILGFSVVGAVVCLAGHPLIKPLRTRPLCYLGTISYGLYFYHMLIYAMISPSHFSPHCMDTMFVDGLKLLTTFLVAVLSWEFFEKPILRIKDRYPYPRSASSHPHPPAPHLTVTTKERTPITTRS